MKKKLNLRRRLYCSVVAILSLFAADSNSLYAANNSVPEEIRNDSRQNTQEPTSGTRNPDITLVAAGDLVGTWIIDRVKIKKTVNGASSSEKTYSMKLKQKVESFTDCPSKITFTADGKVIFEYNDKGPSEGNYKVEGNKITRMTFVAGYEYVYTLTDANEIQLLYSIDYVHNSDHNTDQITEEYAFFGTRE